VGPRVRLDGCEKSRPHRDSIPGPSSPQSVAINSSTVYVYKLQNTTGMSRLKIDQLGPCSAQIKNAFLAWIGINLSYVTLSYDKILASNLR
jgi:hypothetical protein